MISTVLIMWLDDSNARKFAVVVLAMLLRPQGNIRDKCGFICKVSECLWLLCGILCRISNCIFWFESLQALGGVKPVSDFMLPKTPWFFVKKEGVRDQNDWY